MTAADCNRRSLFVQAFKRFGGAKLLYDSARGKAEMVSNMCACEMILYCTGPDKVSLIYDTAPEAEVL